METETKTTEKAKVTMRNWQVYVYDGRYNLSGTADEHPRLGKNTYVAQTSSLLASSVEDDVLIYETCNTIYLCPLKYMTLHPYGSVIPEYLEELTHLGEHSEEMVDKVISVAARIALSRKEDAADPMVQKVRALQETGQEEIHEKKEQDDRHLMEIAGQYEDCIYIEVSSISHGNTLAYHLGDLTGTVEPTVHIGMFQDSVFYTDSASKMDFRYFPKGVGNTMETYAWSVNIKRAVIKNQKSQTLYFNGEEIAPGETKVFEQKRS